MERVVKQLGYANTHRRCITQSQLERERDRGKKENVETTTTTTTLIIN